MDFNWERTSPEINISHDIAKVLLAKPFGCREILSIGLLTGGKKNTLYKIGLKGYKLPVVLKIFHDKNYTPHKEKKVIEKIRDIIPTPRLIYSGFDTDFFPYPYSVYEYAQGIPLNIAMDKGYFPEVYIMENIGEMLAYLHSFKYTKVGFLDAELNISGTLPPLSQWYSMFLNKQAVKRIGPECANSILHFIDKNPGLLETIEVNISLVHGDFRPANIMVLDSKITGVIDWEFVMAGHSIADIGQFIRYESQIDSEMERRFLGAYSKASKIKLPCNWRKLARLRDMVNLLQMLGTREEIPFKAANFKNLIRNTLDYLESN